MKPRSLDQIIGIAACAGSAGPVFLLMYTLIGLDEVGEVWSISPLNLILGCAIASLIALPVAILIAIAAHVLARRNSDTFMKSAACGTAIGFIVISIASEITVGGSPLSEPGNVRDIALLLLGSFIMSALYWLVAVRRIRGRRASGGRHEPTIQATD